MRLEKFVKWLNRELPKLVSKGLVTDDGAERIRSYYRQEIKVKGNVNIFLGIFAVIGAVCVGFGVILFFAFGWDTFSRSIKTLLAFTPLVISLVLLSWAVLTDKKGFAIREGSAIFNILSVGAAIALISQIYNIPGEFDKFLLVWTLLSIPLVYLMSSTLAAFCYLIGISFWAGSAQSLGGHAALFWPLFAAVIPYYWRHLSRDRFSMSSLWLSFAVCASLSVAIGIALEKAVPGLWVIVYSSFFSALYLGGRLWFDDGEGFWQSPFRNYGMSGIVVLSYLFTFNWVWYGIGWSHYRYDFDTLASYADYVVLITMFATAVLFLVHAIKQRKIFETAFGIVPIMTVLCYAIASRSGGEYFSAGIFSSYVFFLGGLCIYLGVKKIKLGLTNSGIFLSGLILLTRFLDSSLGILERGLVFIFIGIVFILSNIFLSKKLKQEVA